MSEFVRVAGKGEIADGDGRAVEVNGRRVAVFNAGGTFYAIDDTCTHRGGPLSEGSIEGTVVTCPWHGASFDLTSGEVVDPPAPSGVARYEVKVEGEEVFVKL